MQCSVPCRELQSQAELGVLAQKEFQDRRWSRQQDSEWHVWKMGFKLLTHPYILTPYRGPPRNSLFHKNIWPTWDSKLPVQDHPWGITIVEASVFTAAPPSPTPYPHSHLTQLPVGLVLWFEFASPSRQSELREIVLALTCDSSVLRLTCFFVVVLVLQKQNVHIFKC